MGQILTTLLAVARDGGDICKADQIINLIGECIGEMVDMVCIIVVVIGLLSLLSPLFTTLLSAVLGNTDRRK